MEIRASEECVLRLYIRYSSGLLPILARDLKSIIIDIPINGETQKLYYFRGRADRRTQGHDEVKR